ncbi:MAG: sugar phosphate isomerase/epimerase [Verrucomicrobiales bacterium]|nr:sugar phosphate isomerase/epimerase [Verrucomicrobiales bacterium]
MKITILPLPYLLAIALVIPNWTQAENPPFTPAFYPFQNGMTFETTEQGAQLLKKLGYDGIGAVYGKDLTKYLKAYNKAELKIFSIYVGGKLEPNGHSYDPVISEAITNLKGSQTIVELYVRKGKKSTDEQAIAFVREISDQAKASGLRVALYPHTGFHIATASDALRIAKASGRDNVGVAFNLCHFLKVEPLSDLRKTLEMIRPKLWSVSTCGADARGTSWQQLIRPLDEGTFDQASLLRHLREIDYKGPVGLQCYAIKISPNENLNRSIIAWKKILAASQQE